MYRTRFRVPDSPSRPHAVPVQHDLEISAADGVRLLANRYYPAGLAPL